jgi:hypothetical protein
MTARPAFLSFFLIPTLVALRVQADEPPAIGQSAVTTPSGLEEGPSIGLEMLSLPLESRSSISDYVGRNLPGGYLGDDGRLRLRGGRAEDTAYELDGLRLRHLDLPVAMIERLDVASAGHGAAWSDVLGGVVGATTRSGSNRFHADVDISADFREPVRAEVSPAVSGPILRDRLFYALAITAMATRNPPTQDAEGIISDSPGRDTRAQGSALKLTFLPHPAHRLEALTVVNATRSDNGAELGTEVEAQPSYEALEVTTALRWLGRWSRLTAHGQVAFQRTRAEELPMSCRSQPETCENVPSTVQKFPRRIRSLNWPMHRIDRESEWQFASGLEAVVLERPWIRQRLLASSRVSVRQLGWSSHHPGDRLFEYNQGPEAETVYFANDPRFAPPQFGWFAWSGSSLDTNHALESETRLFEKVWIVPGLGLAAGRAHTDYFTIGAAALTPHLGLAWDVSGNGRTWLRASSHQRASADLASLARFGNGSPANRKCNWDPDAMSYSRGCVFSGGGFSGSVGLPCGATGVDDNGNPCLEGLRLPRAWEHAMSAEHDVGLGARPFLELVYRRPTHLPRITETNRVWNAQGEVVTGYRSGRQEVVNDYTSAAGGNRYLDLTVGVRKETGALRLLTAYTYSHHQPQVIASINDYAFGSPDDDRPHAFRALVSYALGNHASLGFIYRYDSGAPFSRFYRNNAGANENYRAGIGVNPGTNLNDPTDDRPTRLPPVKRVNLQLRLRTKGLVGLDFHLHVDVMNVLADGMPAGADELEFYPRRRPGRWARVGLEYRY